MGFQFLSEWYPDKCNWTDKDAKVLIPEQTWPIHPGIAEKAGFEVQRYRYFNSETKSFDLEGMLQDLENADDGQIVILHACAHNPTGCDPTEEDWQRILEVMLKKKHYAVFDSAYQGFASGDLDKDIYSLRLFAS